MFERYYLTGGSGFLGGAILSVLLEEGAKVRALLLPSEAERCVFDDRVEVFIGDVCDKSSIEAFLDGADKNSCVIHSAGIVSIASRPDKKLFDVNVGGTKNIVDVCKERGVGKLVYISSVHALPEKPKGEIIEENLEFNPLVVSGAYGKSKATATKIVLDAAKNGLDASAVLPSGIIGPKDTTVGSITFMLRSFLYGKLPLAIKGGYNFVDVRDVAKGVVACAEKGQKGRYYILSGHYATVKEILEAVKPLAAVKRTVLYLPVKIAKLIAPIYEKNSIRHKKPLVFTPYSIAVLDSNGAFSNAAAVKELGFSPRKLSATLKDTAEWILQKEKSSQKF